MIVLPLLSFLLSPLLGLGLLCCLSELCRERVLGPMGLRPMIPDDTDWRDVYRLPDAMDLPMEWSWTAIQERDQRLGRWIERSWYPVTDRHRRRRAFEEALDAWRLQERQRATSTSAENDRATGATGATAGQWAAEETPCWWVVLGVTRTASWSEVQRAHRRLISRHGAYLRGTASREEAATSHPKVILINKAFEQARRETGNV